MFGEWTRRCSHAVAVSVCKFPIPTIIHQITQQALVCYNASMKDIHTNQRVIVHDTVDMAEFYLPSIQAERVEMILSQHNIECLVRGMGDDECLIQITDWNIKAADIQKILDSVE